jgi:hypothetical protein
VEAARAFDRAALCIYGELAITNFGLTVARQDPTPVSAHILMVKQEYDRFRKQQQEEQQAAEMNATTLSIAAADPALQQLLQAQQIALGSSQCSSSTAPQPTSQALDLGTSSFSESLPDLSVLPSTAPALSSDLLVLDSASKSSLQVPSNAAAGPVNTDWLLGQLANLGITKRPELAATAEAPAAPAAPRPLATTFSYPMRKQQPMNDGFASLAPQVQLRPTSEDEVQSSSMLASGWTTTTTGAAQQPQQLVAPGGSASGLMLWAQQGGLVSPHTPFGNLMLQAQGPAPAAVNKTSNNQQVTLASTGGGMGGGGVVSGAAQVTQGLDLDGMLQAMQEEARLEALIRQQQEQLAQLEQLREHQRALIMQQYRQ